MINKQVPLLTAETAQAYEREFVTGLSVKTNLDFHRGLRTIASGEAVVVSRAAVERVIEQIRSYSSEQDDLEAVWSDALQCALNQS